MVTPKTLHVSSLCQKSYSSVEWEQLNPVLLKGEFGYDTDKDDFKIGDSITSWSDLPYFKDNGGGGGGGSSASDGWYIIPHKGEEEPKDEYWGLVSTRWGRSFILEIKSMYSQAYVKLNASIDTQPESNWQINVLEAQSANSFGEIILASIWRNNGQEPGLVLYDSSENGNMNNMGIAWKVSTPQELDIIHASEGGKAADLLVLNSVPDTGSGGEGQGEKNGTAEFIMYDEEGAIIAPISYSYVGDDPGQDMIHLDEGGGVDYPFFVLIMWVLVGEGTADDLIALIAGTPNFDFDGAVERLANLRGGYSIDFGDISTSGVLYAKFTRSSHYLGKFETKIVFQDINTNGFAETFIGKDSDGTITFRSAPIGGGGSGGFEAQTTIQTYDWVDEGGYYKQTIHLYEIDSGNPIIDLITSYDPTTAQLELVEWAKIYKIYTGEGVLEVYATEPITMPLEIMVKVV